MPSSTWKGLDKVYIRCFGGVHVYLEGMGRDAYSKLSRGPDEPAAGEDIMREPAVPLAGFQGDSVICGVEKNR